MCRSSELFHTAHVLTPLWILPSVPLFSPSQSSALLLFKCSLRFTNLSGNRWDCDFTPGWVSLLHQKSCSGRGEQPHRASGLARVGISPLEARLAQNNVVFPVVSQLHSPKSCLFFSVLREWWLEKHGEHAGLEWPRKPELGKINNATTSNIFIAKIV